MREKIKMQSSASAHYYTTTKNKKAKHGKLELKTYDPYVRQYVLYKEKKIK